ncbi:MAG: hypothetical protein Q4C67_09160 [Deinococcus sp.]|nr:hypothetical protein [Deinococcus sp.]
MNTNEIRRALRTAAAKLDRESRGQYPQIRYEMVVAAGTLRSIATGMPGCSPEEALDYLRRQRTLLRRQAEPFACRQLSQVIWDALMAEVRAELQAS